MSSSSARGAPVSVADPSEPLWPADLASELGTTFLSTSAPAPSESPLAPLWSAVCSWAAVLRGLTLAASSAVAAAVAAGGLAILVFLLFTTSLAPANDTFTRPLSLDFPSACQPGLACGVADLVAEATFLPEAQTADGLPPADPRLDARFLAPGQGVDVWAELVMPQGGGQGVAQVAAVLASLDGRPAAKASRTVLLRSDQWSPRSLALAPLRWLGLAGDTRVVRVPLFTAYKEKRDVPFMSAKLTIKARNPQWAPEIVSAELKVRLRLGFVRRAVYWLRPGRLALPLLGAGAVAAMLGGGAAAAVFLLLLLLTGFGGGSGGGAADVAADEVGSVAGSDDVEVSSVSGISDASSSLLRALSDEEGEPPSPRLPPNIAGTSRAVAAERWLDALPASGSGAARSAGKGPGPGRPADSAMGSEGGGFGRLAGGALRRRGSGPKPAVSE